MESPSQTAPPLACINWELVALKGDLLRRNPVESGLSLAPRGAGLADSTLTFPSGPLRSVEGRSTAFLFLRSTPRKEEGLWKIWGFYEKLVAVSHQNNQNKSLTQVQMSSFLQKSLLVCTIQWRLECLFHGRRQFSLFSHFNVHMLFCCL